MLDITQLPNKAPEINLEELLEAGCHFGHQVAKWHPRIKPFVYMEKDGVHIFDLVKTAAQLQQAYNAAYAIGKAGKSLVVVGTKRQAREALSEVLTGGTVPYINSRWLGGLLTNWDQVKKSLKRMVEIEEGLKTDKFKGYTKYERGQLEKELGRLKRFFEGVRTLKDKPDALFIIDINHEKNAVKEATALEVLTIGIVDSVANPDSVDIAIPANDDGKRSVEVITKFVLAGYNAGLNDK